MNALPTLGPRLLVVLTASTLGCGFAREDAEARAQREEVHPRGEYVAYQTRQIDTVALEAAEGGTMAWPSPTLRKVTTLGDFDGPPESVLGSIEDAAIDGTGYIYILDGRFNNVRVLDPRGRPVHQFGRQGGGPGEFRRPTALFVNARDEVVVADVARRLHVFRRDGDAVGYSHTISVEASPNDVCATQHSYVLQVNSPDTIDVVQLYTPDGELEHTFGRIYVTDNALVRHALSEGYIACGEEDVVYLAPASGIADVRSHDREGIGRWATVIEGYTPIRIVADAQGMGVQLPEDGFHRTESLIALPGGRVLLQIAHVENNGSGSAGAPTKLYSLLFRGADGHLLCASTRLPRVIAAAPETIVTATAGIVPRIEVWKGSGGITCGES